MAMGLSTASVVSRSLYQYVNIRSGSGDGTAPKPADVVQRSLYQYVSRAKHGWPVGGETLDGDDVLARVLYLYVNISHDRDPTDVAARALYQYEAYDDTELFPWVEKIDPVEQYRGGQVQVYGDGFGDDEAAEGGSVRVGVYDPTQPGPGAVMGVVSWASRSPGLWPANGGVPTDPAITVTVPVDAESGMLSVEETT